MPAPDTTSGQSTPTRQVPKSKPNSKPSMTDPLTEEEIELGRQYGLTNTKMNRVLFRKTLHRMQSRGQQAVPPTQQPQMRQQTSTGAAGYTGQPTPQPSVNTKQDIKQREGTWTEAERYDVALMIVRTAFIAVNRIAQNEGMNIPDLTTNKDLVDTCVQSMIVSLKSMGH